MGTQIRGAAGIYASIPEVHDPTFNVAQMCALSQYCQWAAALSCKVYTHALKSAYACFGSPHLVHPLIFRTRSFATSPPT